LVSVEGNRLIVTPGVDFSVATVDQEGNWSICASPLVICSCLVLSFGTSVQVTLFRYGLPGCQ
jgi:hypothetical protein